MISASCLMQVEETKHVHNEKQPKRILRVVEQGLGTETLSQHGPGLSEAGQNPQKEQQILLKHLQVYFDSRHLFWVNPPIFPSLF